ncbi:MAG: aminotransferase class I/II-fold pyridoxal phosphate-dependent enzyme [Erysipelotrichaceae bacterium]|nr:aminotransferase class I/II-fold pyridoxal phosphate-dependent enzyme [Erysipelotrichaceae bacterium]
MEVECSWIVTTPNVVSSINACLLALTQPNESVLVLEPVYMPFFKSVEAIGRKVVFSSLVPSTYGYMMNLDDIEAKVKKHDVKMVLFCSPHNPVGRVWREEEIRPFLEIMNRYNVIVVSDEIHMDFMFKGQHHLPLMKYDPNVIMLMSASKTFNLASAHVSQMIVQNRVIRKKIKTLYSQLGLFHHHEFGIRATTIAYSQCDDYIDELCEVIESNVNLVKETLKDTPVGVTLIEGTYLVWLNVSCVGLPTSIIQKRLIHEASLWLHDGSIFGPTVEGYLRMNVATSPQVCLEACHRLIKWLKGEMHESKSSV